MLLGVIGAGLLWLAGRVLHLGTWAFDVDRPAGSGPWSAVVVQWGPPVMVALAVALRIRATRPFAGTALLIFGIFGFAAFINIFWRVGASPDLESNIGLLLHLAAALIVLAAGVSAAAGTMSDPVVRASARLPTHFAQAAVVLVSAPVLSAIVFDLVGESSMWTVVAAGGPLLVYPLTLWMLVRCLPRLAPAPAAGALICSGILTGLPQIYRLFTDADLFELSFAALLFVDAQLVAALLLLAASVPLFILGIQPSADEGRGGRGARAARGPELEPDSGDPVVDVRGFDDVPGLDVTGLDIPGLDVNGLDNVRRFDESREHPGARGFGAAQRSDPQPTRQLCLALHLNDDLLREASREVIDRPGRGIAPSFGIDLGTVVRHALLARRRMWLRDALLTALSLLLFPQLMVFVVTQDKYLLGPIAVSLLLGWIVVAVDGVSRKQIAARQLSPEGFEHHRQPRLTHAEERKILALQALDRGNVTAYGGYFPFVGSGSPVGGWSFALSVLKGREGIDGVRQAPHPFELAELYEAVRLEVDKLGIEGVHVEDRLYVDGEQAARDPRFRTTSTPAHLIGSVTTDELDDMIRTPERINRVYRCLRIYGWGGEYVLSIYLNFTRTGRGLFAETRYFLLLPTKEEDLGGRESLRKSIPALIRAIPRTFGALRDLSQTTASEPNAWGATTSLRELAQSKQYRRYFQQLDRDMTSKIVERQLLDTITEFLRDRNIDTFEIEERQTAILNNGLIVSGTLNAESLAVGVNSQSLLSRVSAAIKSPTEERSAS